MPRRKNEHYYFPLETALLFHPEVTKFTLKNGGVFRAREEYDVLTKLAFHSIHRRGMSVGRELLDSFGRLYSRSPDAVIEFLALARRIIKKWETTKSGKVIMFLCSKSAIPIEDREFIYDADDLQTGIVFINRFNGRKRRISFENKSNEERDKLSFPQLMHVGRLSDKELARILEAEEEPISPEIIKKARQEMAQIYHEIKHLNNPAVRAHGATGIRTKEYEQALAIYLKGKK